VVIQSIARKTSLVSKMSTSSRQYDLVVLGASGYTGKLVAEYITAHLPTNLRWAIAGRSVKKLEGVSAECKALNPQGSLPGKST
jgi:short subunit dehydrogenase-like uncharacterized protein